MAKHFSANQYEGAFKSKPLQNWEVPNQHKAKPAKYDGFTVFIANNKGHLSEGVKRSKESPWGKFVGTWELPLNIPGNATHNPTARKPSSAKSLTRMKEDFDQKCQENIAKSASTLKGQALAERIRARQTEETKLPAVADLSLSENQPTKPTDHIENQDGVTMPISKKLTTPISQTKRENISADSKRLQSRSSSSRSQACCQHDIAIEEEERQDSAGCRSKLPSRGSQLGSCEPGGGSARSSHNNNDNKNNSQVSSPKDRPGSVSVGSVVNEDQVLSPKLVSPTVHWPVPQYLEEPFP